jgi:cytochrome c oxidase assembly factor CtaG
MLAPGGPHGSQARSARWLCDLTPPDSASATARNRSGGRALRVASRRVEALGSFLRSWTFDPVLGLGLIGAAAAYLWAVLRVDARDPDHPWGRRQTASFLTGLALCWFVLLGPVGAYDDTFFWAHMAQHIALMMLVAPLLLLGSPVLLLLRVSTPAFRRTWVLPVLHGRVLTALTRPAVGWLVFAGVLIGTHFSPFYEFSLEHPLVHDYVEHPLYLAAALLYYYPLLPGNPGPRRVPYNLRAVSLFSMMFPETMTGFFLYASTYVMYPFYLHVDRPFGPPPLVDQQLGGALMWGGSMIIDTVWVALAVAAWLRSEARLAARIDVQTLSRLPGVPHRP